MNSKVSEKTHKWSFFKAGGVKQPAIRTGLDIANVSKLDKTLFAALACPVNGLNLDAKTLQMLDADGDGRIRYTDISAACDWAVAHLKNPDILLASSESLNLDDINDQDLEGKIIKKTAQEVLKTLGRADGKCVEVADFSDPQKIFANTIFNADDIVIADATESADLKNTIADIIKVRGASSDRSGKDGVSKESVDAFFSDLKAYIAWKNLPESNPAILVFGEDTAASFAAFCAVRAKIEDYFTRAEILNYDENSAATVNPSKDDFANAIKGDITSANVELLKMPVARIARADSLNLQNFINPAWNAAIENFKALVLSKFTDSKEELTNVLWAEIKAKFSAYKGWIAAKKGDAISSLDAAEIARLDSGNDAELLAKLFEKEAAAADTVSNIVLLEKLVRLNRDLFRLLKNFVNFEDFYSGKNNAIFQSGTLFFDRRACSLCMKVTNPAAHATLSPLSYAYLIYCDCSQKSQAGFSVVCAVTRGDSDNIMVGRNGIFVDAFGGVWDATVTKIVTNPISIGQAFWSPYKSFVRWVSEYVAKKAAVAEAGASKSLEDSVTNANVSGKKIDIGTVAAIGVAIGGITTALGLILKSLSGLNPLMLPVLAVLAISGPSMIMAWLKLRLRNLGPLLDANSWAVNTRAKINLSLANVLTRAAKIPSGSKSVSGEVKGSGFGVFFKILIFALLVVLAGSFAAYKMGYIKSCKGESAKTVQTQNAPASSAPTSAETPTK